MIANCVIYYSSRPSYATQSGPYQAPYGGPPSYGVSPGYMGSAARISPTVPESRNKQMLAAVSEQELVEFVTKMIAQVMIVFDIHAVLT
jgi:hypothetical protein